MFAREHFDLRQVSVLLRGESDFLQRSTERWSAPRFALHAAMIVAGSGLYGATMGWWRDPQQAVYVAIKFPLIVLLTTFGNAVLNGMLAPLLGLNIPFRQSFLAMLASLAIASAILGSFSPLAAFLVLNAPPMSDHASSAYAVIKLTHVAVISFAGMAGTIRLFHLLTRLAGNRATARRVLFAWLTGNLFLGSQLSWILRPFIGSPSLPVEFFRKTALQGNFYENVFQSLIHLFRFH